VARITCDKERWPIVVVTFPRAYSDAEYEDYLSELSSIVGSSPTALVIDTRLGSTPTALQRQRLMQFVKENWKRLNALRGIVFIVDSVIARHALTAVSWVVAKPCPIVLASSMGEAQAWAAQHRVPVERQLQR
jgi:hypothetical protein